MNFDKFDKSNTQNIGENNVDKNKLTAIASLDDKTFAEKFNDLIFDVEIDKKKAEVRITYTERFD